VCESTKKRNVQPELLVPKSLPPGINHLQYVLSGVGRYADPNPIQKKDFFRCQHLVSFETPAHAEKRAKDKDKTAEKDLVD